MRYVIRRLSPTPTAILGTTAHVGAVAYPSNETSPATQPPWRFHEASRLTRSHTYRLHRSRSRHHHWRHRRREGPSFATLHRGLPDDESVHEVGPPRLAGRLLRHG